MEKDNSILVKALAFCIGAIGAGLFLKWVLPALGAMVGIAGSLISVGISASAYSSWVIPAASTGLAITGGASGIILLVKVVENAGKKPFEWALPVISIISGLIIDSCKELYDTDSSIIRIIYGSSVALLFLLGGILWSQKVKSIKRIITKSISIILFLTPPFLIYLRYCQINNLSLLEGFNNIPLNIVVSLLFLFVLLIIITFLSWVFKNN
ncbi:MAG: hypothetical protein R3353_01595 [Salegentibacter mishustinae]|nr:hypothetical protein [Salegentibacter mishustinae]